MATIDTSYVTAELKAIAATSKPIRKLLYDALATLEEKPGSFPKLDDVPRSIRRRFPTAIFRKVKLIHDPHGFRLVVIHWRNPNGEDHVDVIYAFSRKEGYEIDWTWV